VNSSGVPAGALGLPVIDGPKPTIPSNVDTTRVTMFRGANAMSVFAGVTVWVVVACEVGGNDTLGAARAATAALGWAVAFGDVKTAADGSF
jgi:hypothetical protein